MQSGETQLDAFRTQRRFLALVVAGIFVCFAPMFIYLSFTGRGAGLPGVPIMVAALIGNCLMAWLCYRPVMHAPTWLAWYWGLLIPFLGAAPDTNIQAHQTGMLIAPALALMLGGWRSVLALGVLPVAITVLQTRPIAASPYIEPTFLLTHALIVAMLVTAQRALYKAMADMARTNSLAEAVARASDDIIILRDGPNDRTAGEIRFVSSSFTKSLGYSIDELMRAAPEFSAYIHPSDSAAFRESQPEDASAAKRSDATAAGLYVGKDFRVRHKDGHWVWLSARKVDLLRNPDVRGIVTTLRDVTAERTARECHERELAHRANHDVLTGLPNRRKLGADLDSWLARKQLGEAVQLSVIFCDLDAFKHVNDGLGHAVGDELLQVITKRMQDTLDPHTALYRFGGDEFVALMAGPDSAGVEELARKLVGILREPLSLTNHRLVVTASIGVAHLGSHTRSGDLLRDADVAMYAAKAEGKNRILVFDAEMQNRVLRRHNLEQAMRRGIDGGEFRAVYQPKVNAQTLTLVGFETLLRWRSAELGDVMPTEFIPVAEETGLIVELGRIALREGCETLAKLANEPGRRTSMSINLSVEQMLDPARLRRDIEAVLSATGVPPRLVELEITESMLMSHADVVIETLHELKAMGLKLSVDDFGTGYSSLSYLRRFPIDALKLDRAFITDLDANQDGYAIVSAIISLARTLGIHTVAEGVETEAELRVLASLGCEDIQGYVISRPLELDAALAFQTEWRAPHVSAAGSISDTPNSSPNIKPAGATGS